MTDLVKVKKDFITLSSLSEEEAGKYESLIYMETEYINSLLKNDGVSYSIDTSSNLENAKAICNFAFEQCTSLIKDKGFAFEAV